MQKLLIYAAFYLCFPQLSAQDAYHSSLAAQFQSEHDLTGGQWVLPETATFTASSNYGAVVTNFSVSGQPFRGGGFRCRPGRILTPAATSTKMARPLLPIISA